MCRTGLMDAYFGGPKITDPGSVSSAECVVFIRQKHVPTLSAGTKQITVFDPHIDEFPQLLNTDISIVFPVTD